MNPAALLLHLRGAPWARWLQDARVGLDLGDRYLISPRRVTPWVDEPVDAWVWAQEDDVDRMLRREAPAGEIRMRLGERALAPRLRQAHAVLTLASLGWCGPWPDPAAAAEHVDMVREAILAVAIGPKDGEADLFPPGAPVPPFTLRFTDGARPAWVTVGLFEVLGAELCATGKAPPLRAMRALVLDALEHGRFARSLVLAMPDGAERTVTTIAEALPLPTRVGALVRVG